jgi:hypothetical protein
MHSIFVFYFFVYHALYFYYQPMETQDKTITMFLFLGDSLRLFRSNIKKKNISQFLEKLGHLSLHNPFFD